MLSRKEYEAARNNPNAKPAEARVNGILRGGFVLDNCFYYCSKTWCFALLSNVSELKVH